MLFMSVNRRWASRDVIVEDKAASATIFLEDAAPVGLLSTLLVASVAESSEYSMLGTSVICSQLHQGCRRISKRRGREIWIGGCGGSGGGCGSGEGMRMLGRRW